MKKPFKMFNQAAALLGVIAAPALAIAFLAGMLYTYYWLYRSLAESLSAANAIF